MGADVLVMGPENCAFEVQKGGPHAFLAVVMSCRVRSGIC